MFLLFTDLFSESGMFLHLRGHLTFIYPYIDCTFKAHTQHSMLTNADISRVHQTTIRNE